MQPLKCLAKAARMAPHWGNLGQRPEAHLQGCAPAGSSPTASHSSKGSPVFLRRNGLPLRAARCTYCRSKKWPQSRFLEQPGALWSATCLSRAVQPFTVTLSHSGKRLLLQKLFLRTTLSSYSVAGGRRHHPALFQHPENLHPLLSPQTCHWVSLSSLGVAMRIIWTGWAKGWLIYNYPSKTLSVAYW